MRRQFGEQALQDRFRVAGQRHRRLVQAVVLLQIGIDAHDLQIAVHAPLPELDEEPRSDGEHHVGLAPKIAAERQRDGKRVAPIEHAAAAAEREHRRLQHRRERRDFFRGILRAATADDQRPLGGSQQLGGLADRIAVDPGGRNGQGLLHR